VKIGLKLQPFLKMVGLSKTYMQGRGWERQFRIQALDGVDLTL
jgi:hypothetical protein